MSSITGITGDLIINDGVTLTVIVGSSPIIVGGSIIIAGSLKLVFLSKPRKGRYYIIKGSKSAIQVTLKRQNRQKQFKGSNCVDIGTNKSVSVLIVPSDACATKKKIVLITAIIVVLLWEQQQLQELLYLLDILYYFGAQIRFRKEVLVLKISKVNDIPSIRMPCCIIRSCTSLALEFLLPTNFF